MPVTNRVGLPTAEYLKAQPPSWESIQTGLSIFALFVIIRYCVQRIYSWLRPTERLNPSSSSSYYHPATSDLLQQRYQLHSWLMDEKSSQGGVGGGMSNQHQNFNDDGAAAIPIDSHWRPTGDSMPRHFISRLPPALPLTPPELSNAVFTLEERPQDHESFIHQPNPDYMSSTSTSSFQVDDADSSIPRRRSYTRTLPIGAPIIRQGQASTDAESGDQTFLPSSFPSSSRLLPPAPPSADDDVEAQRNVDIQGEIISVLDRDGAGWTRHTRVYGGGACLACAASGGGGFYGATVTPEEMR